MTTTKFLTERITFVGLRSSAERLGIPGFARMRKQELIKAISETQKKLHKRAEYSGILVSLNTLRLGKQQQWLASSPEGKSKEEIQELSASKATHQTSERRRK